MKLEKGQSLIEVLIALAAATAIVAAIAVTVITSLRNVDYTKNQNLATQYSREGIEVTRQLAKNGWDNFLTYDGYYCLSQNSTNLTPKVGINCGQNVGDANPTKRIFFREIDISPSSALCSGNTKVISSVSWSDSKCSTGNIFCHSVVLETCLADINSIKAP